MYIHFIDGEGNGNKNFPERSEGSAATIKTKNGDQQKNPTRTRKALDSQPNPRYNRDINNNNKQQQQRKQEDINMTTKTTAAAATTTTTSSEEQKPVPQHFESIEAAIDTYKELAGFHALLQGQLDDSTQEMSKHCQLMAEQFGKGPFDFGDGKALGTIIANRGDLWFARGKNSGRPKGSKNTATVEKELAAHRRAVEEAKALLKAEAEAAARAALNVTPVVAPVATPAKAPVQAQPVPAQAQQVLEVSNDSDDEVVLAEAGEIDSPYQANADLSPMEEALQVALSEDDDVLADA